ncbi:ROK family protein [uncultured Bacteroides sp.]|uniref:ROK family protein n=1 Tax=uncultured Bacteroides sp. TaxID=162156 RepID=UPI002AA748FB|nr:ROK family protein [uncultured Bacteroides sp.]
MNRTYLSLDLGGTKLLVGEVNEQGDVLNYKRYQTGYINQESALDIIRESVDNYLSVVGWATNERPVAMGVGLIGRVNNATGVWHQIDIDRTTPLQLAKELSIAYDMPCYADNDVKAATRAERLWGYGQRTKDFIYINIGTGIAAGIVTGGALVRGGHCNAGEVGHTNVGIKLGLQCVCGREDCVELIASGIGFDKSARFLKDMHHTSLFIPADERVDVREVYRLSREGDELCTCLVENAAWAISNLIMNLVRVTDPDTVVLGGGIVSSGFLYQKIIEKLNQHTMRFVTNGVVLTKLDPDFIGLIGAAAVAMNK